MRQKLQQQATISPAPTPSNDHARDRELEAISEILDAHPQLLEFVLDDLPKGRKNPRTGRRGMTSEQVLRALIIKQLLGLSYDALAFTVGDSLAVRRFCRFDAWSPTPGRSTLQSNIKSITAKRDLESFSSRDGDHSPLVIFETTDRFDYDQFSQEFQLTGQAVDDRLNWLAGLYYFEEQGTNRNDVFVANGTLLSGGDWDHDTWALFGQLSYDFTDKLSLTAGLRYTEETKRYTPSNNIYGTPFAFNPASIAGIDPAIWATYPASITVPVEAAQVMFGLPPGVAPAFFMTQAVGADIFVLPNTEVSLDIEETQPMVSLSYQFTDDVMLYGTYGESFKGGGFTQRTAVILLATPQFQPEFVTSYEIGVKTLLLDNRLRFNAALFYNEYDDIQILVRQDIAPVTFNAGDGTITGGEIDFDWLPIDSLRFTGGIGWLDAEYDTLSPDAIANGITLDTEFTKAPDFKANVSGIYTFNLAGGAALSIRGDYTYIDDIFHDPQNHIELFWEGYSLWGAALTYETADLRWLFTLGGLNLGDEQFMSSGSWSLASGSYNEAVFDRGRQYYANARFGF